MTTYAEQRAADEEAALGVTCPMPGCRAEPQEPCTYAFAIRDDETGLFVRWDRITRTAHHERIATATGGRVYGYTLRALDAYLRRASSTELAADYRKGRA